MFLCQINYIAVLVSSVVFFIIGSLWYSVIFRSMWTEELQKNNVTIKEPTKKELSLKMLLTFLSNFIACIITASLVLATHSTSILSGLILGLKLSIGFAATAIALVFIWEGRSLRLFLIDWGYSAAGIIVASIILSLWR